MQRDDSDLQDAMQRLQDSETRTRAILETAVDAIVTIDERGVIESTNPAAERLFGYTAGEMNGQNVKMLMPEPYRQEHDGYLSNYLRTGHKKIIGIGREVMGRRKDGSTFPMELAVSEVRLGDRRLFTGIVRDVSERKRAEASLAEKARLLHEAKEAAEAANAAKDRFLAVLSHELRTPLTPVLMAVASMEADRRVPSDLREDIAMIRRNVELETKLIDDLLDLSRIVSGKLNLQTEPTDVNEAVRDAYKICRQQFVEKDIRVHKALQEHLAPVAADPGRLRQVLWNILTNAAKFTLPHQDVYISTGTSGPGVVWMKIRDTGIGIAPEVVPRIFDAFEQGSPGVTRQFGGMGLGLAISKALVDLHHGTLRAESEGSGKGATFTLELPEAREIRKDQGRQEASGWDTAVPLRILVVEDHVDTSRTLARILKIQGYQVTTAGTVQEALQVVERESFDLVLCDIGLPDASGYDLMPQLRARSIKGIAMSGFGMEEDVRRSLESGFSEHVVKPVQIEQLLATIQRVSAA